MWFDKNELALFPRAPKSTPDEAEKKLAIAKVQLEANIEDRERSAEDIVAQAVGVVLLIIRLLLLR
jgi:hypothetical protein